MLLNMNQNVKVKLTQVGRDILREQHFKLCEDASLVSEKFPYTEPNIDSDGYTQFQLWILMKTFGPHLHLGINTGPGFPFEMDIYISPDEVAI